MSQGQGGGAPRRWDKAENLKAAIAAYFQEAKDLDEPIGILALCDHTEMSYDCFVDYESGSMDTETEKFSELCKKAKQKVMGYAEKRIYSSTAGATFQLVNLTRKTKEPYKNAQHQEHSSPGKDFVDQKITVEFVSGPNEDPAT